jgi:preprotein translocase subunit SecA
MARRKDPEKPTAQDDLDDAAHVEIIKRGFDAKVAEAKHSLAQAAETVAQTGLSGAITIALLELGIERHLEHFDEKSAMELAQGVVRKVMLRRGGPLQ